MTKLVEKFIVKTHQLRGYQMNNDFIANQQPPKCFLSVHCNSMEEAQSFAIIINKKLEGFKAFCQFAFEGYLLIVQKKIGSNIISPLSHDDLKRIHQFFSSEVMYAETQELAFS